jgi:hypothetical protein
MRTEPTSGRASEPARGRMRWRSQPRTAASLRGPRRANLERGELVSSRLRAGQRVDGTHRGRCTRRSVARPDLGRLPNRRAGQRSSKALEPKSERVERRLERPLEERPARAPRVRKLMAEGRLGEAALLSAQPRFEVELEAGSVPAPQRAVSWAVATAAADEVPPREKDESEDGAAAFSALSAAVGSRHQHLGQRTSARSSQAVPAEAAGGERHGRSQPG